MKGERTFLPVIGGDFSIPMTVLNGKNPGKTGLITAGIHSEEFVGIESAIRLAGELREDQLFGKLYILHPLNLPGFRSSIRNSMVPEDGKNLNRVFPGKKEGSLSERIAYTVMSAFSEGIDFAIDLHGGQVHEELLPHVYFLGESKEKVKETSLLMARHCKVPYIIQSKTTTGGLYNCLSMQGVPSILLERGCQGRWSEEEVKEDLEDLKNLLRLQGMVKDGIAPELRAGEIMQNLIYVNSPYEGCWYPKKKPGEKVSLGEVLGEIRDYHGEKLWELRAEKEGHLLYQISFLSVHKDEELAVYG